ncbi:MAG TPA: hypothetical protein VF944_10565 [Candidatus Bathyarchaeia archaeon]
MDIGELHEVEYLGDGAYVGYSGSNVVIFTYNGMSVISRIYLEASYIEKLSEYSKNLERRRHGTG